MSLQSCRSCKSRDGNKPITCIFAWRDASLERHAYKSLLCAACFTMKVAPVDAAIDLTAELACPSCHISTETDYDAVYFNLFIPGYGRRDIEAPFCNACAAHYRIWVQECSDALEDRGRADVGPTSTVSSIDVLRALGLRTA